jgi:hypothetical protein
LKNKTWLARPLAAGARVASDPANAEVETDPLPTRSVEGDREMVTSLYGTI